MKIKTAAIFVISSTLSACGFFMEDRNINAALDESQVIVEKPTNIYLQHPQTRVIVHCYASVEYAANTCANTFKQQGYILLRNIPYKVANYDFLPQETYPTRRWRENELTPRW